MKLFNIDSNSGVTWVQSAEPALSERFIGAAWHDTANSILKTWNGANWVVQDRVTGAYPSAPPIITSSSTASGTQGGNFSYQITATNSPTSFNATGLPSGITINTATGLISGSYASTGSFSVTLYAANAMGTGISSLSLTINAPSWGANILAGISAFSDTDWSGYPASNMTDGNIYSIWTTTARAYHWAQCNLPVSRTITKFTLSAGSSSYKYGAATFELQGCNNGSSWVTFFSTSVSSWTAWETKTWTFANSTPCTYFRFLITSMISSPSYAEQTEMTAHEYA